MCALKTSKKSLFFTKRDVKNITFAKEKNKLVLLGSGAFGKVYLGKVTFKDGSKKRIAIKEFRYPMPDKIANKYQKVINDLRKIALEADARFPNRDLSVAKLFPKGGMLKIKVGEGERWVLVTQAFWSKAKGNKTLNNGLLRLSKENEMEFLWIVSKLAEKGYFSFDLFVPGKKNEIYPLDIDFARFNQKLTRSEDKARKLLFYLNKFVNAQPQFTKKQKSVFFNYYVKTILSFDISKSLKKEIIKQKLSK